MSQIFEIRHEGGSLSEYDASSTDSGDLSVSAGAALANSSYGLAALVDDTNEIYAQKNFTATDELRTRLYLDPNGIAISSGAIRMAWWKNAAGSTRYNLYLSGSYTLTLYATTDSGGWTNCASTSLSDAPHYVELYFRAATGAGNDDGIAKLWVDGAYIGGSESLDNDANSDDITNVRLGASDLGSTSGTLYIDEIVMRDDDTEIGPRIGLVPFWRLYRGLRV